MSLKTLKKGKEIAGKLPKTAVADRLLYYWSHPTGRHTSSLTFDLAVEGAQYYWRSEIGAVPADVDLCRPALTLGPIIQIHSHVQFDA